MSDTVRGDFLHVIQSTDADPEEPAMRREIDRLMDDALGSDPRLAIVAERARIIGTANRIREDHYLERLGDDIVAW
jgi:hypothetical protein